MELCGPWRRPDTRILSMSEVIIWILGAPGEIVGQHILDMCRFGSCSGEDLGSKLDANKEIVDFLKSMLSRTWEHGFFQWFGDGFGVVFDGLGWFLNVSVITLEGI